MSLYLGKKYTTLSDWEEDLKLFERSTHQKYYKKNSRTLKAAAPNLKKKVNGDLYYYEVLYKCIHGGKFQSRSRGIRNTSTHKMGCLASIKIQLSSDGQYLEIKLISNEHCGHEQSQMFFDHLPQNRRLDISEYGEVEKLITCRGNKKIIQSQIANQINKNVTLRDLSNIGKKLRTGNNDLKSAIKLLSETYNCNVSIFSDESDQFKGLYFSSSFMRNTFDVWPQFLAIDGTYKLLNNGCTLFLLLVEDGNGHSDIVGACLTTSEDRDTLLWFLNCFKDEHSKSPSCIMSDKDLLERECLKEVFPEAKTYICLFHAMKVFNREISTEKLQISKLERKQSLEFIQKLIYAKSESAYHVVYNEFKENAPKAVFKYFERNWEHIRDDWALYKMNTENLKNRTNNRLESINHKIKQVILKNSTLTDFIKQFFLFLSSQLQEKTNRVAKEILTRPISIYEENSDERKYQCLLTDFAFKAIINEIQISKSKRIYTELIYPSVQHIDFCDCYHYTSMLLPYRHIFLAREIVCISLYDEKLCHERWKKDIYLKSFNIDTSSQTSILFTTVGNKKTLTVQEKRKKL